jgi:hypothetical protein
MFNGVFPNAINRAYMICSYGVVMFAEIVLMNCYIYGNILSIIINCGLQAISFQNLWGQENQIA